VRKTSGSRDQRPVRRYCEIHERRSENAWVLVCMNKASEGGQSKEKGTLGRERKVCGPRGRKTTLKTECLDLKGEQQRNRARKGDRRKTK